MHTDRPVNVTLEYIAYVCLITAVTAELVAACWAGAAVLKPSE